MEFKATPALLGFLYSQLEEFPHEYKRDGEAKFPGGSVYQKLCDLDQNKGGKIEVTEPERRELESLLDSIAGPGGWDTLNAAEARTCKAALRQVQKAAA